LCSGHSFFPVVSGAAHTASFLESKQGKDGAGKGVSAPPAAPLILALLGFWVAGGCYL
jgi:hypothetical protein